MEQAKKGSFMIIAILIVGNFLALINETVMNVALPKIIDDFGISANTAQWLSTGYMLMIGIAVPITAFLMQRFTTRQLFLSAMTLFTAGTLLAGIAPVFPLVLAGRIIQGSGTGLILPLVMNVILTLIPPQKRGTMTGILTLVILFAPAIGPVISGYIVEHYSWRVVFFMMLPVSVFMIFYAAFRLKNVTELKYPKIDILSILLSTVGFGGIVFGFSNAGEAAGWSSPKVIIGLAAGVIGLILFVMRQLKLKVPMLDMRPFRSKIFSVSVILMWIVMMLQFSMMLILPLYFQMALELSPLYTGILMLPGGLVLAMTSLVAGRLFDKLGFKPLLITGVDHCDCRPFAVYEYFKRYADGGRNDAVRRLHTRRRVDDGSDYDARFEPGAKTAVPAWFGDYEYGQSSVRGHRSGIVHDDPDDRFESLYRAFFRRQPSGAAHARHDRRRSYGLFRSHRLCSRCSCDFVFCEKQTRGTSCSINIGPQKNAGGMKRLLHFFILV